MRLQVALNHIRNSIRLVTLVIMFTAVVIATAAGFAHSYAGLFDWGMAHKLTGWKADTFPLLVDMFILVGELGLFLIALDGLKVRKSVTAWLDILIPSAVIAAGWGASLWFNINHLDGATQDDQITFAIPPIAAMIGLMILLRTVHRYAARLEDATVFQPADAVPEPVPLVVPDDVPSVMASTPVPPVVRTWHIKTPTLYRVGTDARTVWPVLAPTPVPLDVSTNGNGVLSDWSLIDAEKAAYGPESHAQTMTPVPVRDVQPTSDSPTAARTEPRVEALSTDERHAKGLTYCAEFQMVTKKLPSQRVLATYLGMKNRDPARDIITHAKELIKNDTLKDHLPDATHTAG